MIVLAHPSSESLDHRLAETVRAVLRQTGVRKTFHDLYAESFDPVLTADEANADDVWDRGTSAEQVRAESAGPDPLVDRHRRELAEAKALIVIHPDWYGKPPAIFTGWLDRVLLHGSRPGERSHPQAPALERVLVINSVQAEADPQTVLTDPLGLLWREQLGRVLGSPKLERLTFGPASTADETRLGSWTNATERATGWACGAAR